jgi:hypothetical protein
MIPVYQRWLWVWLDNQPLATLLLLLRCGGCCSRSSHFVQYGGRAQSGAKDPA